MARPVQPGPSATLPPPRACVPSQASPHPVPATRNLSQVAGSRGGCLHGTSRPWGWHTGLRSFSSISPQSCMRHGTGLREGGDLPSASGPAIQTLPLPGPRSSHHALDDVAPVHTPALACSQSGCISLKPDPVSCTPGPSNTRGCGLLFAFVAKKCHRNDRPTSAGCAFTCLQALVYSASPCGNLLCVILAEPAPQGRWEGGRELRPEPPTAARQGYTHPPQRAAAGPEGGLWK